MAEQALAEASEGAEREYEESARELEAHAAISLEWPLLLEAIAERAVSTPGKRRLSTLTPAVTRDEALQRMARVRAVLELGEEGVELPRAGLPDLVEPLARIRLGAPANAQELAQIEKMLDLARALRFIVDEHAEGHPELGEFLGSEPRLDRIAKRLSECLEPSGMVSDLASPALAEARARFRELASELRRRLTELAQRYADVLSGQYYTERDGRYVLPVRADAHYRVDGIVLGSSGSGGTLFVEPKEVTQLGNRLRVQEAAVERETARVLAELSALILEQLPAVQAASAVCVEADVVAAIARFAVETRSRPLDVTEEDRFDVYGARHPLLVLSGGEVVANDLVLEGGKALVISGPNAGGKTVALKCLGLFAWMARAGLPIPAGSESVVGWFDHVLADVGDEQSLVRSLSTFSAHVQTLARILEHSRRHVLVLLDEVAAGTDPEEGAALAGSILEALTLRGAAVAVTTHYEKLKELASDHERLENASVGFDFQRMAPTFRLTMGVPGASSALAVAGRYGLPERVVERARELLPRTTLDRERLLQELDQERERLFADRRAAESELERQRALSLEMEAERERVHDAARERIEQETRDLLARVRALRAELLQARQSLQREGLGRSELRGIERAVSRVAAEVALGGALAPSRAVERSPAILPQSEIVPGTRLRVRATGAIGTVLGRPERGRVQLRVGALRIQHKLEELEHAPANARAGGPKPVRSSIGNPLAEARRTSDNTLDMRGVRVEDASSRVDAFLDRMLGEGESVGFVLHGHGTGALRDAVREHLGSSSYVEHVRAAEPAEGGPAFTVFWVR